MVKEVITHKERIFDLNPQEEFDALLLEDLHGWLKRTPEENQQQRNQKVCQLRQSGVYVSHDAKGSSESEHHYAWKMTMKNIVNGIDPGNVIAVAEVMFAHELLFALILFSFLW